MLKNTNLHSAKRVKNDEFYTQLTDIEKELKHYTSELKGKVVYLNCDDYRYSNFYKYFKTCFDHLGLKKVICTCFSDTEALDGAIFDGTETIFKLKENGDFRSNESIEFLKECDIVITNPPFSLFREYVAQLMEYDKKFLIIGNVNAITYKEIFPFIKNNKMWLGMSLNATKCNFIVPDWYEGKNVFIKDGIRYGKVNNAVWFTNIDNARRNEGIILYKKYNPIDYPKYDNYDGINVNRASEIPSDYYGAIGVPITFLSNYNPNQFEIIKFRKGDNDKDLSVNGKCPYFRILIKRKIS